METYIKYKRIKELVDENKLEEFFDNLIKGGWEIIYYYESEPITYTKSYDLKEITFTKIPIIIVAGKRQSNII